MLRYHIYTDLKPETQYEFTITVVFRSTEYDKAVSQIVTMPAQGKSAHAKVKP